MSNMIFKLFFIALLALLLNGCSSVTQNYAPVTKRQPDNVKEQKIVKIVKEEPKYHLVKKGDTLYAISVLYDLDYRLLAQWNKISAPYKIGAGQKIIVSDPNSENKIPHEQSNGSEQRAVANQQQNSIKPAITSTSTIRTSPQKIAPISLDYSPSLTENPPYKSQSLKNPTEIATVNTHKKSIISIDNDIMLKLNFRWPIKGKILKAFSKSDNKGIDIAGELEQDVSAAEAGKVVYSGQSLIGYGQLLIIKHNDLYLSAYANNSQVLVTEGYTVEKGQIIAKLGQAGSNKTALHFEIRKNGKPVNPVNYLPKNQ